MVDTPVAAVLLLVLLPAGSDGVFLGRCMLVFACFVCLDYEVP
jgi:hypothetical protein